LVRRTPGLRIPGALNAFEIALRALLRGPELAARVVAELGEPIETAMPALTRHAPTPERVADAGIGRLVALGLGRRPAGTLVALARALADGVVCVEPGGDAAATHRALLTIDGVGDRLATLIVMRALYWPDAFPASDRALQRAVGVPTAARLSALAEQWRPWRAYAALHLWRSAPSR
jgi:AraC family transcriptional regulator of adaptative response / DNA-3-methyladenine glycosylase II